MFTSDRLLTSLSGLGARMVYGEIERLHGGKGCWNAHSADVSSR